MARRLELRKELLTGLTGGELGDVGGGTTTVVSRVVNPCVTMDDPVCRAWSTLVTGGCVPTFPC
jgi:hypothetical protein